MGTVALSNNRNSSRLKLISAFMVLRAVRERRRGAFPLTTAARTNPLRPATLIGISTRRWLTSRVPFPYRNEFVSVSSGFTGIPCCCQIFRNPSNVSSPTIVFPTATVDDCISRATDQQYLLGGCSVLLPDFWEVFRHTYEMLLPLLRHMLDRARTLFSG